MTGVRSRRLNDQRCELFAEIHAGGGGITGKLAKRIGQKLGHKKLTVRVKARLRRTRGVVSIGGRSRWKVKAFLPDRRWPVARWRKERGHWRIEKSCRDDNEGDLNTLEGNRGSRSGGEMGGRGVDYVLDGEGV